MQKLAPPLINSFVTFAHPRHRQRRIHMVVMARQIQTDQPLEQQRPARPGAAEENEQAGGRAAVRDHVEHGAELRALLEVARGDAVEGVEEAGDAVEDGAGAGVEGHVVEGGEGEDDTGVACRCDVSAGDYVERGSSLWAANLLCWDRRGIYSLLVLQERWSFEGSRSRWRGRSALRASWACLALLLRLPACAFARWVNRSWWIVGLAVRPRSVRMYPLLINRNLYFLIFGST
jgi:hypothetical protein